MALVKWYAHKNGTPLFDKWFPMAGDAYVKTADVEAWISTLHKAMYLRHRPECLIHELASAECTCGLTTTLDALRGGA